jgi:prepilin-type N-terminal cleavage/methylation domain-containing protein
MNREKGFSLIELLIVVAIILVIAAIAIPNFIKSRIAANEASAVGSLRSMHTSLVTYSATYVGEGFPAQIQDLQPGNPPTPLAADILDPVLSCVAPGMPPCVKSGYIFIYAPQGGGPPRPDYTINANPQMVNRSGIRYFYIDASGVIRQNIGAPADNTSQPVPG